jgi:hypothetical protein
MTLPEQSDSMPTWGTRDRIALELVAVIGMIERRRHDPSITFEIQEDLRRIAAMVEGGRFEIQEDLRRIVAMLEGGRRS